MTIEEFIKEAAIYYGERLARDLVNDYTEEEIAEHGREILKDIAEDFREFCLDSPLYN